MKCIWHYSELHEPGLIDLVNDRSKLAYTLSVYVTYQVEQEILCS